MICRRPGPLLDFFDEMVSLLSCSPDDGTPLDVLGDFSFPPEKLRSSELINFFSRFDLTLSSCPPTHRVRNQLNQVFIRSCSTSALSVTPLTVSDHHAVTFSLPLKFTTSLAPTPHTVTTCHNLKSLSPSALSSTVVSSLQSTDQFGLMSTKEASTQLSSLFSSLDALCPLTSPPARSPCPLLQNISHDILPFLTTLINTCLTSGLQASLLRQLRITSTSVKLKSSSSRGMTALTWTDPADLPPSTFTGSELSSQNTRHNSRS